MKKQAGFTLVELVVVIAVLGILAATALPRFVNVQSGARVAAGQGLAAALRSAANMARASWIAAGSSGTTVSMDGTTVNVTSTGTTPGYPDASASGIGAAIQSLDGKFTATWGSGTGTTSFVVDGKSACTLTYDASTGLVSVTALNSTNCS